MAGRVTTLLVRRPLSVNQHGQLSQPSLQRGPEEPNHPPLPATDKKISNSSSQDLFPFQTQSALKPVFGRGSAPDPAGGAYDAPTPPSRLVSTGIARGARNLAPPKEHWTLCKFICKAYASVTPVGVQPVEWWWVSELASLGCILTAYLVQL